MIKRLWRKLFGLPRLRATTLAYEGDFGLITLSPEPCEECGAPAFGKVLEDWNEAIGETPVIEWSECSCHKTVHLPAIIIPHYSPISIETEGNIIHVSINFSVVNDASHHTDKVLPALIASLRLVFEATVRNWQKEIDKRLKKGETDVVS